MTNNYTQEDILDNLDMIHGQYPQESLRTIWEIYCDEYNVDYDDDNTIHAKTFDLWVKQIKLFIY